MATGEDEDMLEVPKKKFSKLVLVDLAGSERASANSGKGDRFTEGKNINQSLLALGTLNIWLQAQFLARISKISVNLVSRRRRSLTFLFIPI
jgi:hypothetical protein